MITLTTAAQERITEILAEGNQVGYFVRLLVNGGGCQGFSYAFSIENQHAPDDAMYGNLVIDQMSEEILGEAIVDYTQDLASAHFTVSSPKMASKCGCGHSFSV